MMAYLSQAHSTQPSSAPSPKAVSDKDVGTAERGTVVLILNKSGLILHYNQAATELLGCAISHLVWQPVSNFLPELEDKPLMINGKVNPRLRFLSRFGHVFTVKSPQGSSFPGLLFFNEVETSGQHNLCLVISPAEQGSLPS